jgi:epoxyqueuosine reductase
MRATKLKEQFEQAFDVVGIIRTKAYLHAANDLGKVVPEINYPTMVVLGLAYPMRNIKHTMTHLVPSFYTFGEDYHTVLKNRIEKVMKNLPYDYIAGVDNHPHDERLAATLAGIGFFGKNQLIINKAYGSYLFLSIVMIDVEIDQEIVLNVDDDCGTCRKCIDACPTHALFEGGYDMGKCISHYNQSKRILTDEEIKANYCLFGCDICQMVCPKNINKGIKVHPEFELSGKEMVSIVDLFTHSEKSFKKTYGGMSYLWKGKTILMRNALMVMLRQKNTAYNEMIEASIIKHKIPWYSTTAQHILNQLELIKSASESK